MSANPNNRMSDVLLLTEPRFVSLFDHSVFPNRLCMRRSQWTTKDVIVLFLSTVLLLFKNKPRVILFAGVSSTDRVLLDIVKLFTIIKRSGIIRRTSIILWSPKSFSTKRNNIIGSISYKQGRAISKFVTLYKTIEENHPELKEHFQFVPFPAWQITRSLSYTRGEYVFTGGEAQRDFRSVLRAVEGLPIPIRLRTLGEGEKKLRSQSLPPNCKVHFGDRWANSADDFIMDMRGSRFVVVPLFKTDDAKGLTMIVEALSLGKPVVSTTSIGLSDYLEHGVNSILVDAGDVSGYRDAILKLWTNDKLFNTLSTGAKESAKKLTKGYFLRCMIEICNDVKLKTAQ